MLIGIVCALPRSRVAPSQFYFYAYIDFEVNDFISYHSIASK